MEQIMIDLYDGNNVMRRAMEKHQLPLAKPMSLRQRYEATCAAPAGTQLWIWDGYDHNDRRRDIYPPYKMNRDPAAEDIYAQIKLWREILALSPAVQIAVRGWEADDVISTLAGRFARMGIPVRIHSNDMDFAQLTRLPNVSLIGVDTKGVEGRWVPLYKAMVGDKSDNIAGIPGFGPGAWDSLVEHRAQIERAIVAGQSAGFVGLPFKPKVLAWLQSDDNIKLLQNMLTVTYFDTVPDDELEAGIIQGDVNRLAAHTRMSEFFL
jgi:5'-3' exonuclease